MARTDLLTAYFLHTSRDRVAVDEFDVLLEYTGTVVHDALAVYDSCPATQRCAQHASSEN